MARRPALKVTTPARCAAVAGTVPDAVNCTLPLAGSRPMALIGHCAVTGLADELVSVTVSRSTALTWPERVASAARGSRVVTRRLTGPIRAPEATVTAIWTP